MTYVHASFAPTATLLIGLGGALVTLSPGHAAGVTAVEPPATGATQYIGGSPSPSPEQRILLKPDTSMIPLKLPDRSALLRARDLGQRLVVILEEVKADKPTNGLFAVSGSWSSAATEQPLGYFGTFSIVGKPKGYDIAVDVTDTVEFWSWLDNGNPPLFVTITAPKGMEENVSLKGISLHIEQ